MPDSSDITLDPGVLEGSQGDQVPISDLYGMPVFHPDIEDKIQDAEQEEAEDLKEIRQQVFEPHTDKEAEELGEIREQIFTVEEPLSNTNASVRSGGYEGGALLAVEIMAAVFLAILLLYQRHRKKKRKEIQNDAYDYGR